MLNLNDVSIFVQLVRYGGITAASKATNIPTSTLSKRLAQLEGALGARLIQRTSRAFTVTELGRDFYRHAAAMLIEAESAENVIKGHLAEPRGMVRITASVMAAQISLSRLLPELAERYPDIEIALHATDRFVDVVQEGFDIAIRAHFGALPDSRLSHRRLGTAPNYLVAADSYFAKHGRPAHPAELSNHFGLLSLQTASGPDWCLRNGKGDAAEVNPKPRLYADEPNTLINACLKGLGIASLPCGLCRPFLDNGSLKLVFHDWHSDGPTTTLLMPSRRGQLPAVRATIDFLADRLVQTMQLS